MTTDKASHILARLGIGFHTNSTHLEGLEKELALTLKSARDFGKRHDSPDDWKSNWHNQWDDIEGILRRMTALAQVMDGAIESGDKDRLKQASQAYETFQSEDAKLVVALSAIQTQASGLGPDARKDWNHMARIMESHLEIIHAYAQVLQIKIELLTKYSKAKVDEMVKDIISKLPKRGSLNGKRVETEEQELRKAALEIEQEQHKFLGLLDVVKSLLILVDKPEARVREKHLLRIDDSMIAMDGTRTKANPLELVTPGI